LLHSKRSHLHFTGVNGQIAEFGWQICAVFRREMASIARCPTVRRSSRIARRELQPSAAKIPFAD
jgi:hypothetical protein